MPVHRLLWLSPSKMDKKEKARRYFKKWHKKNRDYYKKNRKRHLATLRKYYYKNRDRLNKECREYRLKHRDELSRQRKEYRLKNKDKVKKWRITYYKKNREKILKYTRNYFKTHPYYKSKEYYKLCYLKYRASVIKAQRKYYYKNKKVILKKMKEYQKGYQERLWLGKKMKNIPRKKFPAEKKEIILRKYATRIKYPIATKRIKHNKRLAKLLKVSVMDLAGLYSSFKSAEKQKKVREMLPVCDG